MITNLKIHNFKSLRNVELNNLPSFMVLVGSNSSGKSNFIKALNFLFNVMVKGLSDTIDMDEFGGYENICFRRKRRSRGSIVFSFTAELEIHPTDLPFYGGGLPNDYPAKLGIVYDYTFEIQAVGTAIVAPYSIIREELEVKVKQFQGHVLFRLIRKGEKLVEYYFSEKPVFLYKHDIVEELRPPSQEEIVNRQKILPTELLIFRLGFITHPLYFYFSACRSYHFTPREAREAVKDPSKSGTILERYGNNLASVIRYMKREKPLEYENIMEHLRVAVSSIESIDNRYTDNKLLSYKIQELGFGRGWLPDEVSDGTLQSICLFIPLEDSRIKIAAYDEPENSVHPWIQEHFVETCLQKSKEKQIIIATHSVALVDEVPPESFYIIKREKGETLVYPAVKESPHVKEIITKNVMSLGEYWKSGAIGGVPDQLVLEFDKGKNE